MGAAAFHPPAQGCGGGGLFWGQCGACGTVLESSAHEWLFCLDLADGDPAPGGAAEGRRRPDQSRGDRRGRLADSRRAGAPGDQSGVRRRLAELTRHLFDAHDLNRDGLLEEDELVALNEAIAVLHKGSGCDTAEVRQTYRRLFRDRLDAEGRPVPYETFQAYAQEVLDGTDDDADAQELILEQFVAEAESGAAFLAASGGRIQEDNPQEPAAGPAEDGARASKTTSVVNAEPAPNGIHPSPAEPPDLGGPAGGGCVGEADIAAQPPAAAQNVAGVGQADLATQPPAAAQHAASAARPYGAADVGTPRSVEEEPSLRIDDLDQRSLRWATSRTSEQLGVPCPSDALPCLDSADVPRPAAEPAAGAAF